ncbi:hypothetical protein BDU57DRAFT_446642 [Ampelomyces quisqualis]|uniref:Uncharacterized protein n=1 Tax=Ampelomyces quisqualis TaxID=50730 RepID=A0A6A5QS23_AMPQU|nr:hypothetical protein BDU57DRAFT_446642 [Ampelomyces quisqualis]
MPPGDPFSDAYVIELEDEYSPITEEQVLETTIFQKALITVPILDTLPRLEPWSPHSPISLSSVSTSPTQSSFSPIHWTNEDLNLALTSSLNFSPPLESLDSHSSPIHLGLYHKVPPTPPTPASFSKHAPIGTGRPTTRSVCIAQSAKSCSTAHLARKTLARNLLESAAAHVLRMRQRYNVLATLYAQSTATLLALQRGMVEMLGVEDGEWEHRYGQLVGRVDEACVLGARIEVFLLGVGRRETEEWVGVVAGAGGMEGVERGEWARVWGEVGVFLGQCLGEMGAG